MSGTFYNIQGHPDVACSVCGQESCPDHGQHAHIQGQLVWFNQGPASFETQSFTDDNSYGNLPTDDNLSALYGRPDEGDDDDDDDDEMMLNEDSAHEGKFATMTTVFDITVPHDPNDISVLTEHDNADIGRGFGLGDGRAGLMDTANTETPAHSLTGEHPSAASQAETAANLESQDAAGQNSQQGVLDVGVTDDQVAHEQSDNMRRSQESEQDNEASEQERAWARILSWLRDKNCPDVHDGCTRDHYHDDIIAVAPAHPTIEIFNFYADHLKARERDLDERERNLRSSLQDLEAHRREVVAVCQRHISATQRICETQLTLVRRSARAVLQSLSDTEDATSFTRHELIDINERLEGAIQPGQPLSEHIRRAITNTEHHIVALENLEEDMYKAECDLNDTRWEARLPEIKPPVMPVARIAPMYRAPPADDGVKPPADEELESLADDVLDSLPSADASSEPQ